MTIFGLNSPELFLLLVITLVILGTKRIEKGFDLFLRLLKFLLSNESGFDTKDKKQESLKEKTNAKEKEEEIKKIEEKTNAKEKEEEINKIEEKTNAKEKEEEINKIEEKRNLDNNEKKYGKTNDPE